jgi:Tfp pilus assembly protein PilE
MTALTTAAAMQERFYMRNNSYSANLNDLGGLAGSLKSPERYYDIAVSITGCPNGQPNGSCFVLSAAPAAGGPQGSDTHCAVFSLADSGQKTAADNGGVVRSDCW